MYCQFYSLKERPFNVTSDPAFFFLSRQHKEALSHLLYGVTQRKGILVITGEIGKGKTTLCRFFLNQLPKNVKTAFILNPYFSEIQLLEAIINDFGLKVKNKSRLSFVWELNRFLLSQSHESNNLIYIKIGYQCEIIHFVSGSSNRVLSKAKDELILKRLWENFYARGGSFSTKWLETMTHAKVKLTASSFFVTGFYI